MIRRQIQFFGRVQGVGFRHTCVEVSHRHEVTGWVKNLPDGSVRLTVEATPKQLEAFVQDLALTLQRHPYARVDRTEQSDSQIETREFNSFTVDRS